MRAKLGDGQYIEGNILGMCHGYRLAFGASIEIDARDVRQMLSSLETDPEKFRVMLMQLEARFQSDKRVRPKRRVTTVEELTAAMQDYKRLPESERLEIEFVTPDGTVFTPVVDSDQLDSWEMGYETTVQFRLENKS